jgi:selenocysteine-specific elongation factor
VKLYLETAGEHGAKFNDLQSRTGWRKDILQKSIKGNLEKKAIIEAENFLIARTPFENLKAKTLAEIENFHRKEPLARGIGRETLREKIFAHLSQEIFRAVLENLVKENKIVAEKDFVRASSHNLELSTDEKILRERLSEIYKSAKLEVPKLDDALAQAVENTNLTPAHARKIFQLFLNSGEILKISDEFYFHREAINALVEKLKNHATKNSDRLIDVPVFKDLAGISRKYAIPLLEYFDREKITRRAGDKRLIL